MGRDAEGRLAFVKVLPPEERQERRERFRREVRVLGDLAIAGIPRLIESNASHFSDPTYELYLAADFIEGMRLSDAVTSGKISSATAGAVTMQICRIVQAAHKRGVMHRDIKPDNVILQMLGEPIAHHVDFGMAHVGESATDFRTKKGQELGNRFLRLPEYSSGFGTKDDPRSDFTFCAWRTL